MLACFWLNSLCTCLRFLRWPRKVCQNCHWNFFQGFFQTGIIITNCCLGQRIQSSPFTFTDCTHTYRCKSLMVWSDSGLSVQKQVICLTSGFTSNCGMQLCVLNAHFNIALNAILSSMCTVSVIWIQHFGLLFVLL